MNGEFGVQILDYLDVQVTFWQVDDSSFYMRDILEVERTWSGGGAEVNCIRNTVKFA